MPPTSTEERLERLATSYADQMLYTFQTNEVPGPKLEPEEREWMLRTLELRSSEFVILYGATFSCHPVTANVLLHDDRLFRAGSDMTLWLIRRLAPKGGS